MAEPLTGDQIEALIDALCKAFWNKRPFRDFLRRCGVSQTDLKELDRQPTKRVFLRWLFERYESGPGGHQIMRDIALGLAAKSVFPDLEPDQIRIAKIAIRSLGECIPAVSLRVQQSVSSSGPTPESMSKVQRIDVDGFRRRFEEALPLLGTADGGRTFERWFVDFAVAHGLLARGKYNTAEREFDGSLIVDAHTFLLELKFTKDKSDAPDVSNFRDKVQGHAAGTLGLFASVSGFTVNAVRTASRAGSPVILLDGAHLYRVFHGHRLDDLIRRLRRHSSETGDAYLPVSLLA